MNRRIAARRSIRRRQPARGAGKPASCSQPNYHEPSRLPGRTSGQETVGVQDEGKGVVSRSRMKLVEGPHLTFHFADDRIISRFHLEGVEAGRRVEVFKIDPG